MSEWRVHWSAGLNDIPSPALHGLGLMSNVTLWPLSLDQPLNAALSLVRGANLKTNIFSTQMKYMQVM